MEILGKCIIRYRTWNDVRMTSPFQDPTNAEQEELSHRETVSVPVQESSPSTAEWLQEVPQRNMLLGWDGTILWVSRTFCTAFPDRCCAAGKLFFSGHSASIPNSTLSNELDCLVATCFATCFCPANLWGLFKMFLQVDVTVSYKNVIFIILLSTGSYVQLCRKCCSDINEYTCCHKKGNDLLS